MKTFNLLLSVMVCAILLTSCSTEKETVVNYGFVCSDNLFKFVEINATYTTNTGEEMSVDLTPAIMETFRDEATSGETSNGSTTVLSSILEWRQSKKYDDDVKANLTISFAKKEGVDYASYKGQVLKITKYAYLHSVYKEENNGLGSTSISQSTSLDLDGLINTKPDEYYGDALEDYIDKLVANPIIK